MTFRGWLTVSIRRDRVLLERMAERGCGDCPPLGIEGMWQRHINRRPEDDADWLWRLVQKHRMEHVN